MRRTHPIPGVVRINGDVNVFVQKGRFVVMPATPPHIYEPEINGGMPAPGKTASQRRPKPKLKKRRPSPGKKYSHVPIAHPVPDHPSFWGDAGRQTGTTPGNLSGARIWIKDTRGRYQQAGQHIGEAGTTGSVIRDRLK